MSESQRYLYGVHQRWIFGKARELARFGKSSNVPVTSPAVRIVAAILLVASTTSCALPTGHHEKSAAIQARAQAVITPADIQKCAARLNSKHGKKWQFVEPLSVNYPMTCHYASVANWGFPVSGKESVVHYSALVKTSGWRGVVPPPKSTDIFWCRFNVANGVVKIADSGVRYYTGSGYRMVNAINCGLQTTQ